MYSKDYYTILGILPTADDVVVKAAYRALAQRYHPDKYRGDSKTAETISRDINEAISVLADAAKRIDYDKWYKEHASNHRFSDGKKEAAELEEAMSLYDRDWLVACEIYPDLESICADLAKSAKRLALTYKIIMLEQKQFSNRKEISETLENEFYRSYFGSDESITSFAKSLVKMGQKEAARALNQYVSILGSDADSDRIIGKIRSDFNLPYSKPKSRSETIHENIDQANVGERKEHQDNLVDYLFYLIVVGLTLGPLFMIWLAS